MEENRFEIPKADYFTLNYNIYCGSMDGFNYRLNAKNKETITVSVWMGRLCLEKSELAAEESFPLDEEGYQKALSWLETQFQALHKGGTV
ncbi:hypothetical protein [Anaeromassilibacillus sp. An200]|uniref:Uncharacterized protein n=1 Tax=Candidatus Caccousia stercoris TaxID=2840723 RepID=A0A9D1FSF2_9FIRM|nr:hypothetical protein [Anaeromassilibacillus sp. An200]OUP12900.1 hypothetical protein B5F35_06445 [Anaeromassilibacillus sp. An200]HIS78942.1 hypothetical protein [Candidatus Caccousia stercoris]